MAYANGELVLYHGATHYWGYQWELWADRSSTPGDSRLHVTGYVNTGAWNISNGYSWEGDAMSGDINIGGQAIGVYHPPFDCRGGGCPDNNFIRTNIDIWLNHPGTNNVSISGYLTSPDDGTVYGNWQIGGIPPYVPPCDPNPVGAWGNAYPTVPSHPTNPNPVQTLPENSILDRIYNGSEWEITYPRTTLENIYRYPPLIRSLANNKSESDAFNIPFDTDESPVKQNWGYYDNTYFYIYRDGLYELSCYTCIVDRKPGVGPKNCGRNVDGNSYAWLKVSKNPSGGNATFLTGRTCHNYGGWINMGVHNLLPLKAGDKVFARVGWQYGNGSTCDGVSGCQGGISYNMACTIGGVNGGANTRMSITPLVFFDEDISYA